MAPVKAEADMEREREGVGGLRATFDATVNF